MDLQIDTDHFSVWESYSCKQGKLVGRYLIYVLFASSPFVPSEKERILECRRVTDGWMAALGGLVILWMFYTFCQVMGVGDPRRLSHGYDYRGKKREEGLE